MPTNNQTTRSRERNPIPSCIVTALSKQQDKLYILHLERDLIKFIKNSILGNIKQPEYIIQAQYLKNSYYRLLSHQLCHYYCLQHWNNTFNEIRVTPTLNFNYQEFVQKLKVQRIRKSESLLRFLVLHTSIQLIMNLLSSLNQFKRRSCW